MPFSFLKSVLPANGAYEQLLLANKCRTTRCGMVLNVVASKCCTTYCYTTFSNVFQVFYQLWQAANDTTCFPSSPLRLFLQPYPLLIKRTPRYLMFESLENAKNPGWGDKYFPTCLQATFIRERYFLARNT